MKRLDEELMRRPRSAADLACVRMTGVILGPFLFMVALGDMLPSHAVERTCRG